MTDEETFSSPRFLQATCSFLQPTDLLRSRSSSVGAPPAALISSRGTQAGHVERAQHDYGQALVCSLSLFYKLPILCLVSDRIQHCVYISGNSYTGCKMPLPPWNSYEEACSACAVRDVSPTYNTLVDTICSAA